MSQPESPDRSNTVTDPSEICAQTNEVTEPAFLGEDYVCTQLPVYITRSLSAEQRGLVRQAYEGWDPDL